MLSFAHFSTRGGIPPALRRGARALHTESYARFLLTPFSSLLSKAKMTPRGRHFFFSGDVLTFARTHFARAERVVA